MLAYVCVGSSVFLVDLAVVIFIINGFFGILAASTPLLQTSNNANCL